MTIFIIPMIISLIFMTYTWRFLNWVWLKPKRLEKILRDQGFNGNSYKLAYGDYVDMVDAIEEANSKPIHLYDDIVPRSLPYTYQLIQKYGAESFQWWGPVPVLHIMDSQLVREVLFRNYQFVKQYIHPLTKYWVGGLAIYEGDKWTKQRKLLNPAFHVEKLKGNMISSSNGVADFDVWHDIQKLTSDAISRTAFSSNYREGRKVFELQKEQTKLIMILERSIYLPGMRFLPTKINRRVKAIAKEIEILITDLIYKRIMSMKAGEARTDDLLGILLVSNMKEVQDNGNESLGMSTQDIVEECKLFYFARQETISTLLVWTMILLCKHPEWKERARTEVLQLFGYEKPGFEDLNHLKIMTMIMNEVLRLYPSVPHIIRRTGEDVTLGNLFIPEGVQIILPTILLHHDIKLWGADAKEFKPERFSEGVFKATKGNASYIPFGGGPRICIGQNFALLEAKLVMAMILQRFSFEISPSYAHAPYNLISLKPQYGAHFILHKI